MEMVRSGCLPQDVTVVALGGPTSSTVLPAASPRGDADVRRPPDHAATRRDRVVISR